MIPEELVYLSTHKIQQSDEQYEIQIPDTHIEGGPLDESDEYRVAIMRTTDPSPSSQSASDSDPQESSVSNTNRNSPTGDEYEPPVSVGDELTVTIDSTGDQGDGIAHVAGGYVVVVENANVGEELLVHIDSVKQNYSFASIVDNSDQTSSVPV